MLCADQERERVNERDTEAENRITEIERGAKKKKERKKEEEERMDEKKKHERAPTGKNKQADERSLR